MINLCKGHKFWFICSNFCVVGDRLCNLWFIRDRLRWFILDRLSRKTLWLIRDRLSRNTLWLIRDKLRKNSFWFTGDKWSRQKGLWFICNGLRRNTNLFIKSWRSSLRKCMKIFSSWRSVSNCQGCFSTRRYIWGTSARQSSIDSK